jgi:hypothetical protein
MHPVSKHSDGLVSPRYPSVTLDDSDRKISRCLSSILSDSHKEHQWRSRPHCRMVNRERLNEDMMTQVKEE